jgi:glycine betaine/proline transport system permease protein
MATLAQPRVRELVVSTRGAVAAVIIGWIVLWFPLRGINTLSLASSDLTPLHSWLNDVNAAVNASRNSSPIFLYVFNEIRLVIDILVKLIQGLISQPAFDRPAPVLGWLGVVAVSGFLAWAFGNAKVALLAVVGLVFIGLQGLWQESMDTLALTIAAVLVSLLIGIPLGVWAGLSDRVDRTITPVLDFMQTMPTFVYLAPLTLFFLIGPASATIATLIYAMPPVVRITAHGIRAVPRTTVEAAESLGSTRAQTLTKVLLPMARRTIVLGVNQTIMAALSMVTIAALIDAPGLGKTVIKALETLDVGTAFNAGVAIVVIAIILDRVTTAAAARADAANIPSHAAHRRRQILLGAAGVVTLVCAYLSYTYVWASTFPPGELGVGSAITRFADTVTTWSQTNLSVITGGFKDAFTRVVLDNVEALLTQSPWWLTSAAVLALAWLLGGLRATITTAICLALLIGTGLWQDAMATLAATLVATAIVMALGVVVGVWMGRSARADRLIRPVLDAAQVMPAFVYLVPFLALFAATRFTAVVAAVVFAAPVAMKIIADGIRAVPAVTVEAATSLGSSTSQLITKVQLPMARRALTLATNQGLIYVLSMVVVGGLVGAGALGFDVVAGFSQGSLFGKGLAAGVAIVLLGVMLDRISQAAARRAREAQ